MTFSRRTLVLSLLTVPLVPAPVAAQGQVPPDPELQAMIAKSNAIIGLMNRTLRISEAWERYISWVNVRTSPTGRERYIDYGIYEVYDTTRELAAARGAAEAQPAVPDLDAIVKRYATAVEVVSPIINQMSGYYERKDYRADRMAEGKELHAKLLPAIETFILERRALEAAMRPFKAMIDQRELARIEATEGKAARWHTKTILMTGASVIELLPSQAKPMVDMPRFDAALAEFAGATRALDTWMRANPGQSVSVASHAGSLVGDLRDLQEKLQRAKGDFRVVVRRDPMMGAMGLTMLISKYNMMVTFAR
jgi:hypothetical protein